MRDLNYRLRYEILLDSVLLSEDAQRILSNFYRGTVIAEMDTPNDDPYANMPPLLCDECAPVSNANAL